MRCGFEVVNLIKYCIFTLTKLAVDVQDRTSTILSGKELPQSLLILGDNSLKITPFADQVVVVGRHNSHIAVVQALYAIKHRILTISNHVMVERFELYVEPVLQFLKRIQLCLQKRCCTYHRTGSNLTLLEAFLVAG
jgi:hypothetical protein